MLTATSGEQHWKRTTEPPISIGDETMFEWSTRLSIEAIRQHTKTDDIPGVTDEMLSIYRSAAVEAAERYTGMLLAGQRVVSEPIQAPSSMRHQRSWRHRYDYMYAEVHKPTYKVRLKYPSADGYVYLYGGLHPTDNGVFVVPPGTNIIHVPIRYQVIDNTNCCNPCAPGQHLNAGMMAAYKAGYASPDEVPALVVLGCLQFITWVIEHPGDEILTVRNRRDARSEGAQGTNNIAIASGALESWRLMVVDVT